MKRLVRVRRSDPAPVGYPLELWQQTLGFEDSDLTALYPGATALTASEVCAKWGGLPLTLFDIYWPTYARDPRMRFFAQTYSYADARARLGASCGWRLLSWVPEHGGGFWRLVQWGVSSYPRTSDLVFEQRARENVVAFAPERHAELTDRVEKLRAQLTLDNFPEIGDNKNSTCSSSTTSVTDSRSARSAATSNVLVGRFRRERRRFD